jgi:hypothetical protein
METALEVVEGIAVRPRLPISLFHHSQNLANGSLSESPIANHRTTIDDINVFARSYSHRR